MIDGTRGMLLFCALVLALAGCGGTERTATTTTLDEDDAKTERQGMRAEAPRQAQPGVPIARQVSTLEEHVLMPADRIQWMEGPDSLPPGAQVAVLEGDLAEDGKLFTARLRVPAGYTVPPHWHGSDEHVTVISGSMRIGMGETVDIDSVEPVGPGGFFAMPAGHVHFAHASEASEIQLHGVGPWTITYIRAGDDPRQQQPVSRR